MDDKTAHLEAMAEALEATGRYRVLRKLEPRAAQASLAGPVRTGLFVDVETTGLDPARDEIIELAMTPFLYDLSGQVLEVGAAFDRRFLERLCETLTTKPWACSMSQVDWSADGHEGARLAT